MEFELQNMKGRKSVTNNTLISSNILMPKTKKKDLKLIHHDNGSVRKAKFQNKTTSCDFKKQMHKFESSTLNQIKQIKQDSRKISINDYCKLFQLQNGYPKKKDQLNKTFKELENEIKFI